jgi:pyruvate kinase
VDTRELSAIAEQVLLKRGLLTQGDLILMMSCEYFGKAGNTNTLKAMLIGKA